MISEFGLLNDKYRQCSGLRIIQKSEPIRKAYYVFSANFTELKQALNFYSDPMNIGVIWSEKNRDKLESLVLEILRFLHNFTASVKSLVDHSRIIMKELYKDQPFLIEYQRRVEEVFSDDFSKFIQKLRDYVLHNRLPAATPTFKWSQSQEFDNQIILHRDHLLEWSGWCSQSKKYLSEQGEQLNLDTLITEYNDKVNSFYGWFETAQNDIHKIEFEEMNRLYDCLVELQSKNEF